MHLIRLPLATSHVHHGPIISLQKARLTLRYDCDMREEVRWAEVVFEGVLAFRYQDFSVCSEDDILGHDYMIEEQEGVELQALRETRKIFLGLDAFEQERDLQAPVKLYRLFFDDVAAVKVVARWAEARIMASDDTLSEWD
jgi:hypothetical protein